MMELDQRLRDHFEVTAADLPVPPLDPTVPVRRARRRRQNRIAAGAAAVVLSIVGVGIGVALITGDDEDGTRVVDNPDVIVDDETEIDDAQPVVPLVDTVVDVETEVSLVDIGVSGVEQIESSAGALWVRGSGQPILRLDPESGEVVARIELPSGAEPTALMVGDDQVWVAGERGQIHRIDPVSNEVVATVDIDGEGQSSVPSWVHGAVGFDSVWVSVWDPAAGYETLVTRVDPLTGAVMDTIEVSGAVRSLSTGRDRVWLGTFAIRAIDPATNDVEVRAGAADGTDLASNGFVHDGDRTWSISDFSVQDLADVSMAYVSALRACESCGNAGFGEAVQIGEEMVIGDRGRRLNRVTLPRELATSEGLSAAVDTTPVGVAFDLGSSAPLPLHLAVAGGAVWFGSEGSVIGRLGIDTLTATPAVELEHPPEGEQPAPEVVDASGAVSVFDYGSESVSGLSAGAGAIWAVSRDGAFGEVVRLDPETGEIVARIGLPAGARGAIGVIAGDDAVWVPARDGFLHRVDPATETVVASVLIFENDSSWFADGDASGDSVWLSHLLDPRGSPGGGEQINVMRRVDPATDTVAAFVSVRDAWWNGPVAATDGAVWVVANNRVDRIDPTANEVVASVELPLPDGSDPSGWSSVTDVVADEVSTWAIGDSFVARIDPATNEVLTTIELPGLASDAALVDGSLLIAAGRQLFRVDVATTALTTVLDLGPDGPDAQQLTITDSHLWFTTVDSDETRIGRLPLGSLSDSTEGESSEAAEPAIVSGADALGVVQEQFGFTGVGSRDDLVEPVDLGAETQDLFGLAVADGSLWTQRDVSHVQRIDPASREVQAVVDLPELQTEEPIPVGEGQAVGIGSFTPVFEAFDAVWASTGDGRLHRIDPASDTVVASINLRDELGDMWGVGQQGFSFDVTADADSLWIWPGHGLPLRIDPDTNTVVAAGEVASAALRSQAAGWVAVGDRVQRVDPETGQVEVTFELPSEGSGLNNFRTVSNLVVTDDGVWVVASASLARIDPSTNRVAATLPLSTASGGGAAALVDDALLVAYGGTVFHIDTTTETVVGAVGVGVSIEDLAVVGDELWMVGPPLQIGGCDPCEWRSSMSRLPLSAVLDNA